LSELLGGGLTLDPALRAALAEKFLGQFSSAPCTSAKAEHGVGIQSKRLAMAQAFARCGPVVG
jgi:hypothetical protein